MPGLLDALPAGARVLLIRLRSLGDCVLTTPAIRLLHQYRPDLQLGVCVERRFAGVYEGNPAIRAILPPEAAAVRRFRASLAVNLHGGSRSLLLTAASGARWRAGFTHYRGRWVYNVPIPRAQEILNEERVVHTAEHVASAMFHLGVPAGEIPRAELFASAPVASHSPYCVIHPFASAPDKAWPVERFVELAQFLAPGRRPVVIGGPLDDLSPFREFDQCKNAPLPDLKNMLAGASLFVGNDSGPAHMAAAFGLPVVVLFGTSNPVIWAPWKTRAETLVRPQGLGGLAVDEVYQACLRCVEVAA
jgi:ADP-heptose:LPS heptosyltransferase